MKIVRGVVFLVIFTIAVSCSTERNHSMMETINGKNHYSFIQREGFFPSHDGDFTVGVSITPEKTVNYKVLNSQGRTIYEANSGSIYQRWYFVWDMENRLWVHNSDTGSRIFETKPQITFRGVRKEDFEIMPSIFYEKLPITYKRRISKYAQHNQ